MVTSSIEREGYCINSREPIFDEFVATKKLKISIRMERRNVTLDEIRKEMPKKRDDSSMRSMGSVNSLNSNSHVEKTDHVPRRRNRNNQRKPRNQSLSNQWDSNNTSPKPLMGLTSSPAVVINHQLRQRSHEDQRQRRALSNQSSGNNNSPNFSPINIDTAASNSEYRLRRRMRASRNQSSSNQSSVDKNSGAGGAAASSSPIASSPGNQTSKQIPKIKNFRDPKPTDGSNNTCENSSPQENQISFEDKLYAKLYNSLKKELGRGDRK